MSNRIVLNQLGIEFESERYSFRDLGFTDSSHKLHYKIKKKLDVDAKEVIRFGIGLGLCKPVSGLCTTMNTDKGELVVISYRPFKTKEFEIFVRGHEETHALHIMGKLPILVHNLEQSGHRIDLSEYVNFDECYRGHREFVAHLGGFYAMQKEGADIAVVLDKFRKNDSFPDALEAFERN